MARAGTPTTDQTGTTMGMTLTGTPTRIIQLPLKNWWGAHRAWSLGLGRWSFEPRFHPL
jgi:hypothetical protein